MTEREKEIQRMNGREKEILEAAIELHQKWIDLVNFHHPKMHSSRMQDALEARKAQREVQDAYDESFCSSN